MGSIRPLLVVPGLSALNVALFGNRSNCGEKASGTSAVMYAGNAQSLNGLALASYPGPFTRAVRAGREIRAWYQSFAHA